MFEELELLEALRGQVEERQLSKEIQLALFDTLFGLADDNEVFHFLFNFLLCGCIFQKINSN